MRRTETVHSIYCVPPAVSERPSVFVATPFRPHRSSYPLSQYSSHEPEVPLAHRGGFSQRCKTSPYSSTSTRLSEAPAFPTVNFPARIQEHSISNTDVNIPVQRLEAMIYECTYSTAALDLDVRSFTTTSNASSGTKINRRVRRRDTVQLHQREPSGPQWSACDRCFRAHSAPHKRRHHALALSTLSSVSFSYCAVANTPKTGVLGSTFD
ncbi:hypothetical protein BAUCODRAFT_267286 [Baudoinia panamericana UAMH 10762]|uniref:Uncharacterized protein n=1 Tax=Baudoinia panamericana (strain UAMH 10762) TaxID=717646 RepID=M2M977_BAUPA|nr:uncharacterized protein BAUCODRAFT_267286 [Baudoinia panamericana UAMH 10762]EMC92946.1 hypothetical protein BAUCODRAFT_267286 [Baudoinia panamericana UAMH 10762]